MGWLMKGMEMEWKWEFDMDIDTQWHVVYWRDYGWHCHSELRRGGLCHVVLMMEGMKSNWYLLLFLCLCEMSIVRLCKV